MGGDLQRQPSAALVSEFGVSRRFPEPGAAILLLIVATLLPLRRFSRR
jgi:hypothetical protein